VAKPRKVYRALGSCVTSLGGRRRTINYGDVLYEGDPALGAVRTELLSDPEGEVETATSAPGEKRATGPKTAAKRQAAKKASG
jgi:hypothetical protein